ncbi:MAG: hypothetical protein H8E98_05640 [Bacteroidetes bacterium]|nr:hypothetical protein [Bacteroidota bacterium]
MINLVTLAGEGSRFTKEGYDLPKPLITVNNNFMVCEAVNCLPIPEKYVFVCLKEHSIKYNIDKILNNNYINSEIILIDGVTNGQAQTAEIGIVESNIGSDQSLLISSCDYGIKWNKNKFNDILHTNVDIIVWTTIYNKTFSGNPESYSWLDVDKNGNLLKTHVKQKVFEDSYNNHAIIGTFYFRKAKYFLEGLNKIYEKNIKTNNEFYIDNIFNSLTQLNIKIFDVDEYYCWGTPKDLEKYGI